MQPDDLIFVDLEASSLNEGYPIEVGWTIVRDFQVTTESHLIRPTTKWYFDDYRWSMESQAVHRITRGDLLDFGKPPEEVATRMTNLFAGKILYSDAPRYDFAWTVELYRAAFTDFQAMPFNFADVSSLYKDVDTDERKFEQEVRKRRKFKVEHRASEDALNLALIWCHTRRDIDASQFQFPPMLESLKILLDNQ